MTHFSKDTTTQDNVLDGTVYAYEPVPQEGVYVTVAGRDGRVYVIAFEMKDLAILHKAAEAAHVADSGATADDLARITQAGMPFILDMFGDNEADR